VGLQVPEVPVTSADSGDDQPPQLGIGMDASVTPLPEEPHLSLVQTTDFFYPLIDDPYLQGRVACANVLSDLYAMGVVSCHNMLMLLGVSKDFTDEERDIVVPLLMKGFQDTAREAGCLVTGGQTVVNPWCTIGGVASSVCTRDKIIMPDGAKAGQVLLLTKPLGTQIAVNAHQWIDLPEKWEKISSITTADEVQAAYRATELSMARLNRIGAVLMHKYGATSCTDVTGFGILGHAVNLAQNQKERVCFVLNTLPIINHMVKIAQAVGNMFQLLQGYSAETSGGLLITIPREGAEQFIKEIEEKEGCPAWIIGDVETGDRTASIKKDPTIIHV